MERKLIRRMIEWKSKPNRKPLILWGARQTGKTWLMKEFGATEFLHTVYISFYNNRRMAEIFDEDYDVHRIINAIEIEMHVTIDPDNTLILFDEVQNAPKVVESLKYFCEDAPEYAIVAAGSLLGVALHEGISFPVGKVDELHLYPMSFEEYLRAVGEQRLADYLAAGDRKAINEFAERYRENLRSYLVVGGMPEVVKSFAENRDYDSVREIQLAIVNQYEGDFGKHIPAREIPRVRMVWNCLPAQLAKENRKFFFGQIKKGARSKDYETALQWLSDAGLIYLVHKVSKPNIPLKSYQEPTSFKVFMIDVGLLGAMSELDPHALVKGDKAFVEFKGALTEQYVLQQLKAETDLSLYYYATEKSTYEVDFLFQRQHRATPLEVKASENLRSRSLQAYREKYEPELSMRTSMSEYIDQGWMINVPLWAVQMVGDQSK